MKRFPAFVLPFVVGCVGSVTPPSATPAEEPPDSAPAVLVESIPAGAMANDPSILDTDEAWRSMIASAKRSVAIAQFYMSEKPAEIPGSDRLQAVIAEIGAAVKRGIGVRVLLDAGFSKKYPASVDRLRGVGAEVRLFDAAKTMGGVLHAKYLVVDEADCYLGSANFDWRSLDHIHELGLRFRSTPAAAVFLSAFDSDWRASGGEVASRPIPVDPNSAIVVGGERVHPVLSPRGHLVDDGWWDLDRLVASIDAASEFIRIQLLSYETHERDGSTFLRLDDALRRAASRGVKVRLLVANWQKSSKKQGVVKELAKVPGIEVRFVNVPAAPGPFIPFARTVHAKYMVADAGRVWLGTSNWGGDYFYKSRNVGVFVDSPRLAAQLRGIHEGLWSGPLAEAVDPATTYEGPRIAE